MSKKDKKAIDLIERQLKDGGFEYLRDSWIETVPVKDKCGWLEILLPYQDDKRFKLILYFENDESNLKEVSIFEQTRTWNESDAKLITKTKAKN